jgi:hypothetical protein
MPKNGPAGERERVIPFRGIDYRHSESYGWLSGIKVVFFFFWRTSAALCWEWINSLTKGAHDEWTSKDRPGKKSRSFLEMRQLRQYHPGGIASGQVSCL